MLEKEARIIDARLAQLIANNELSNDEAGIVQWVLSHTPTIDSESLRPTGKWILGEPDFYGNRKPSCSVCGEYPLFIWSDYTRCKCCPNCGVRMEE